MNRRHALIISLLITLLIANNYYLFSSFSSIEERETVTIKRVIDGDTIELQDSRKIRLLNINAPEKNTRHYEESLNYLKQFENKSVQIEATEEDKYNRLLARIYAPEYLNLKLVELGLASKFLVEESELSDYKKAEEDAITNSLGVWEKSDYADCFTTEIDKNAEVVEITNKCPTINMFSWKLKDESRKTFTFPNIIIGQLTLHTKEGNNTQASLFWNSKTSIWNNDRDSLYLFDSKGGLAHYETYGY